MTIIIVGSNHTNTAEYYKVLGLNSSTLITDIVHGHFIGHTCIQDVPEYAILETL